MSFNPGGGGGGSTVSGSADVALSSPVTGQYFGYNGSIGKWANYALVGTVALANSGGQETVSTVASATGATTLNLANGNIFDVTLTGNVTFAFSGATAGKACSFSLYLRQNATGSNMVTWPASLKWSGGAPTLTTTANAVDILVFESLDGGTTWYGSLVGANFV